jgi:hypothetical protein
MERPPKHPRRKCSDVKLEEQLTRGNISATIPFKQRKRKMTDNENIREGGLGVAIVIDGNDEALSGRQRKKTRTNYPGILPFLDISEDAGNLIRRLENGEPTAVSIYSLSLDA